MLERVTHLIGRPVQQVGLSATVGNPGELLTWLQGSGAGSRPGRVIGPDEVSDALPKRLAMATLAARISDEAAAAAVPDEPARIVSS